MAINFGANERLENLNGLSGIDVDAFTLVLMFRNPADTSANPMITASAFSVGNNAGEIKIRSPVAGGDFVLRFEYRFSTASGVWITTADLDFSTWYCVAVKYDRSSTTNDPTFAVNGSLLTVGSGLTEDTTPVGSAKTGVDSIRFAESVTASIDFTGQLAGSAVYTRAVSDSELLAISERVSPFKFGGSLQHYWLMRNVSDLTDVVNGAVLSTNGTPNTFEHPFVAFPRGAQVVADVAAAAGAASRKMLLLGVT